MRKSPNTIAVDVEPVKDSGDPDVYVEASVGLATSRPVWFVLFNAMADVACRYPAFAPVEALAALTVRPVPADTPSEYHLMLLMRFDGATVQWSRVDTQYEYDVVTAGTGL